MEPKANRLMRKYIQWHMPNCTEKCEQPLQYLVTCYFVFTIAVLLATAVWLTEDKNKIRNDKRMETKVPKDNRTE